MTKMLILLGTFMIWGCGHFKSNAIQSTIHPSGVKAIHPSGVKAIHEHLKPRPIPGDKRILSTHFSVTFLSQELEEKQATHLLQISEKAYDEVSNFLDRTFTPGMQVELNISSRHLSPYASQPGPHAFMLVPLKAAKKEYGFSLAHELTHILMGLSGLDKKQGNRLLDEGFAVYVEERLHGPKVFPNFGFETHAGYQQLRIKLKQKVWPLLETDLHRKHAKSGDFDTMRLAYLAQGSFCKYLIERYGLEKFFIVFYGQIDDFDAVYGKSFSTLEKPWKTFILTPYINTHRK